jgi:hypothetical protein
MASTSTSLLRWLGTALVCVAAAAAAGPAGDAHADDQSPAPLPAFAPHQSDWQPNYTVFPYNLWQSRVTPEQVTAEREACQWFNAQYGSLMGQVFGFQHYLAGRGDDWSAPGVRAAASTVQANLDQSAAFLDPRARTLFIVNYPDQSQYSPLYNGDSFHHLWYQFTQISDKMSQEMVSGVINANIATANVYGNTIRDSGVCDFA